MNQSNVVMFVQGVPSLRDDGCSIASYQPYDEQVSGDVLRAGSPLTVTFAAGVVPPAFLTISCRAATKDEFATHESARQAEITANNERAQTAPVASPTLADFIEQGATLADLQTLLDVPR